MTIITLTGDAGDNIFDTSALNLPGVTGYEIFAGLGNDRIITNDLPQLIFAGRGDDYIVSGDGADIVNAGNGNDQVFGKGGDDVLNGAGGNDYIDGGKGNDVINGDSGDDFIFGRKGNNVLEGGAGNDIVNTGDHTSVANGGTGDDLMVARLKKGGDHVLTGGEGADTFDFVFQSAKKSADLTITDFELGVDDFIVGGQTDLDWAADLLAGADTFTAEANEAGDAMLDIGFNDTITFDGVAFAAFVGYYLSEALVIG